MSGGPVSYATAAGSKEVTSSSASSPKESAGATLSSTASSPTPAAAAVAVASPSSSSSSQAKPASGATNGKQQQSASNNKAKKKSTSSATGAPEPSSPPSRKSVTEFTPAPVPSVNVWQKGGAAASVAAPAAAAGAGSKNPLDPSNWPKPDEKKEGVAGASNTKVRTGGKDKWVPYSNANITPPPPPSSTNAHKPPSSNRKKNSNNNNSSSNNNAGKLNGQSGGGSAGGFNKNNKAASAAPQHAKTNSKTVNKQQAGGAKGGGGQKQNNAPSANNSPNPAQGGFKPRYNNNNNRNGFVPGGGFANGGNRRMSHFNQKATPFYMQTPDFMYNQAAAVAAANGLIQQPFPVPHYDAALGLVIGQVEYYLSVENLCKDIFLRRQMNSKGLVSLNLMASFNRVKSLTNGDKSMLYEACKWAPSCEIIGNKIRPKVNWETWVLPPADRLPGGLDESDESDQQFDENTQDDASKLSFKPANAVPFVPKTAK